MFVQDVPNYTKEPHTLQIAFEFLTVVACYNFLHQSVLGDLNSGRAFDTGCQCVLQDTSPSRPVLMTPPRCACTVSKHILTLNQDIELIYSLSTNVVFNLQVSRGICLLVCITHTRSF